MSVKSSHKACILHSITIHYTLLLLNIPQLSSYLLIPTHKLTFRNPLYFKKNSKSIPNLINPFPSLSSTYPPPSTPPATPTPTSPPPPPAPTPPPPAARYKSTPYTHPHPPKGAYFSIVGTLVLI